MALHFELVTPEKLVRSEEVYQVVVPGTDGDFGVLEGHAPFMSTVRDGAIQVFASAGPLLDESTWLSKAAIRSEEHTSELQSLMRISYAVFCLKKKKNNNNNRIS